MKTKTVNLATSFARLMTMAELEKNVNQNTIFGHSVKLALSENKPPPLIIQMIVDQLQDNQKAVENCIPDYIIRSIEKYWPEIKPETDDLKHINI